MFQCFSNDWMCSFYIYFQNAKTLTVELLDFLGSQAQYLHSLMSLQQQTSTSKRLKHVEMALEAQRNVIRSNPGK